MKKQEITDGNWDFLIILDACRYDDFKSTYQKYLDGELEKRVTRGSNTTEWLSKTFPDSYNYTYISANPYINSKGIPLSKLTGEKTDWNPEETFEEIVDVWEEKWTDSRGTVHPETVVAEAENFLDSEKIIIHFIQPHKPYLTADYNKFSQKEKLLLKLASPFKQVWFRLSKDTRQKIKNVLGFEKGGVGGFYKKGEGNRARKYYRENLEIVLKYVSHLISKIPRGKKVVVTSDHGEAFGEEGIFEHPSNTRIPELVEVPWLEIKKEGEESYSSKQRKRKRRKKSAKTGEKYEKELKKRLKDLGYS